MDDPHAIGLAMFKVGLIINWVVAVGTKIGVYQDSSKIAIRNVSTVGGMEVNATAS